ncbi:MAG: hypothetical protein JNK89_08610 [Saprospiraceae bacterium]|nr:hypothetical protein [Saprospiraceae bacterium]
MKKSLFLMAALLMGIAAFQSCKKSDATDLDVMTSEDLATNEDFSEEIDFATDVAIEERSGGGACPTVTLAQPWGTWPNTITIDYGAVGCAGPNGDHLLRGKIIIEQTAEMFTAGAVRTKTFDNFFIDDVQVGGTKSWTNNGKDADGNWSYTKTATNMVLSYPDGSSTTWNHTHTSTLIQGGNTPTHWDNVWSTTGNSSGTNRNGVSFTSEIVEPLIKKALCRWISEGVVAFTRDGKTASLDFGNGTCDRFGTLTLPNGDTQVIKLRK